MANLDTALPDSGAGSPGLVSELLVEVFLARGAKHHGDVREAAHELRDLFASFGILTEENEALIGAKAERLERRAGRARLQLVPCAPSGCPGTCGDAGRRDG